MSNVISVLVSLLRRWLADQFVAMQQPVAVSHCMFVMLLMATSLCTAQIPEPTDAPPALSPEASAASYALPDGFRMELVACEPLIASPSAVCWDQHGQMFVCELHGYNLEGQLDIDELNKSGQLDTQVRRVQADEKFKEAAKGGTYGVVKRLRDTDGDGRMDVADTWASDLPPAYGLVPARDGVIVACAPDIVFLADRDGDGVAETRQTLLTGFRTGALERGINAPQWSVDGWIYFGRGWGGSQITGPNLKEEVSLTDSDFRIRADGTAIEPVTGGTHTFGFAMTASGDRFVVTTTIPAIYVAPLPWHYLIRNPDASVSDIEFPSGDRHAYSLAPPHPWRQRRADDPEYFQYYNSRYGAAESDAVGWFTAACSPLIYEDHVLPGLHGQYLVCEPSGNLIHRATIEANGPALQIIRLPSEANREFAASSDPWSHPMNLHLAPDGSVIVVDYYREIIEDYSAIPRHLQQQYGLYHGHDRGRIYRLTHRDLAEHRQPAILSALDSPALARETASPLAWRRLTAMRLLVERHDTAAVDILREIVADNSTSAEGLVTALRTLDQLGYLRPNDVTAHLSHVDAAVRIHALQLSEQWLSSEAGMLDRVLAAAEVESNPRVLLQFVLSLGESRDARALVQLIQLGRRHSQIRWLDSALLSSVAQRGGQVFGALIDDFESNQPLLEKLAAAIASRGDEGERVLALAAVVPLPEPLRGELIDLLSKVHETSSEPKGTPPPAVSMPVMEISDETFRQYLAALSGPRDLQIGQAMFVKNCSVCHRVGQDGFDVGPDLLGELAVAEETLVRHLLLPNERLRPGFETILLQLNDETMATGIIKEDGATSVTLLAPGGARNVYLRKDISAIHRRNLSLMPSFAAAMTPSEMASLLGWLRIQLGK